MIKLFFLPLQPAPWTCLRFPSFADFILFLFLQLPLSFSRLAAISCCFRCAQMDPTLSFLPVRLGCKVVALLILSDLNQIVLHKITGLKGSFRTDSFHSTMNIQFCEHHFQLNGLPLRAWHQLSLAGCHRPSWPYSLCTLTLCTVSDCKRRALCLHFHSSVDSLDAAVTLKAGNTESAIVQGFLLRIFMLIWWQPSHAERLQFG